MKSTGIFLATDLILPAAWISLCQDVREFGSNSQSVFSQLLLSWLEHDFMHLC